MKQQVAKIVAAYTGKNRVNTDELPALIQQVAESLAVLGKGPAAPPAVLTPAVPIRRSVSATAITCLDCGWSGQMLKRHLAVAHSLTPEQYRQRWKLAHDYPIVATNYANRRSELAKSFGLGALGRGRTSRPLGT